MALKPLALDQLVGAPLRALVLGDGVATRAAADYVWEVGFETTAERKTAVREGEFEYIHPVPDPANPGAVIETPTRVRVPLLTLFPVPNLRISEATITFAANVVDVKSARIKRPPAGLAHAGTTALAVPELSAVYAPAVAAAGQPAPTMSVTIKVVKEANSEGMARGLDLLSDSITSTPSRKPK